MPTQRTGGKKSKRRDQRPARMRYWMRRTLEKNKVRNLMRCCGMTREAATRFWNKARKGRVNFQLCKARAKQ